jgi:hypothetical protein
VKKDSSGRAVVEQDAPLTLGEALVELERQARQVVGLIAYDQVRRDTTHRDHAGLCGIETAIADVVVALAKRRM